MKELVPPYARIQRIQRDIPVPLIEAGVDKGHLRELVKERMRQHGKTCRCIRCHEVGLMGITGYDRAAVRPAEMSYDASGGREHFLSFELPERDALIGYVRLRTGDGPMAAIRELKVFGKLVPLDQEGEGWQHRGYGQGAGVRGRKRKPVEEGCSAIRVTSGVGVRRYYAALGYRRDGVYMAKRLAGGRILNIPQRD